MKGNKKATVHRQHIKKLVSTQKEPKMKEIDAIKKLGKSHNKLQSIQLKIYSIEIANKYEKLRDNNLSKHNDSNSEDEETEILDLAKLRERNTDMEEQVNELYDIKKEEINAKCTEFEKLIENCKGNYLIH